MLALTAAVVVVAMAARSPLSRSTPADAHSAQGPTTALFMVLAGIGIVFLGALAIVAWSGRPRRDDPPEREAPPFEIPWWWKVVAVLLPIALGAALVAAAVSGTKVLGTKPGRLSGGGTLGGGPLAPASSTRAAGGFVLPSWLPWTVIGIVALAIAAMAFLFWLCRDRALPDELEEGTATRAAVDAAIDALDADHGDPRRAVIAAYAAMQRTFGERGIVRSPAEAPREFLGRTLVASRVTEQEARTLTGLFEEARYSHHQIPEHLRETALSTLRSLRGRLPAESAR